MGSDEQFKARAARGADGEPGDGRAADPIEPAPVTYEYESYWAGPDRAADATAGAAPTSHGGADGASPGFPYDPAAVFGEPAPAGYETPPPAADGRFDADGYLRPTPASEAKPQGGGIGGLARRIWPLILLALTKAKYLLVLLKFKVFGTFVT